jgi:hypothetical protein
MDKTIDMTPSWVSAVRIYIAVLENKNASYEGKQAAREDLLSLASYVDCLKKKKKK